MSSTGTTPSASAGAVSLTGTDAPPVDERYRGVLERLMAALGDAIVASETAHGQLCVRVVPSAWRRAAEVAKGELGCEYFCFLSGLDWMPNPDLSGERAYDPPAGTPTDGDTADEPRTMATGVAGGDTRFQVFARLQNLREGWGVTFKADLDEADPRIESWTPVYRGADWHERETWEMFGFAFDGHPGLRHLYLPGEFEGYPLRKDFPLLAREVKPWPGLVDVEPLPGEAPGESDETSEA